MNSLKPFGKSSYVSQEEALEELEKYKPLKNRKGKESDSNPDKGSDKDMNLGNLTDPENWIFLEARRHGSHEFPDLYVCLNRLAYSQEVENAAKNLEFKVENTAQLEKGTPYIGNISHEEAMKLARALGYSLSLRTGADFLKELKDGARGNKNVFDGRRNKVERSRLETAFKEVVEVRNPYRSEWFSDRFGEGTITYTLIKPDGTTEETTEPVEGLMEDRRPGIDLDYWLDNATPHGLPPQDTPNSENVWYWSPAEGRVAGFVADSDRAIFICNRSPGDLNSLLGVRIARRAAP